MTDTPEDKNPHPDITFDDDSEVAPKAVEATPKPAPAFAAPSKPAQPTPPPKPSPVAPPKPVATPVATPVARPVATPVATTPSPAKRTPTPQTGPSIATRSDIEEDKVNVVALVIDGLAAVVAVAFTILILQDVLPFLK